MASASETERSKFEAAPPSFKSAVWKHFGFSIQYDDEGKKTVNKQSTVCKLCFSTVGYSSGNTSNMMSHLCHHHLAVSHAGGAGARRVHSLAKTQQSLAAAF
uniref:BED-type domain-containing protein n=1 Tax=Anguilla anguilla TaxID=7936 RepID=A0A0E9X8M8_ANGAN